MTDDPVGVERAESAFEKTLSTLASINGVRLLGPETTLPYAVSDLSSDDIDVILKELGAVAVLKSVVRGQRPTIAYHFSLHWQNEMRGYLARLAFDQQITIQGDDGEPMTADTMLEMELSRLINTIQAL